MKIYFTAAISQKPEFGQYYERIVEVLEKAGHKVEAGNLFSMTVKTIVSETQEERLKWYRRALRNIAISDLVVVEISFPSTVNVGHELSVALEKGKPVIALYREDRDPIFLLGGESEKLALVAYTDNDLEQVLEGALEYAAGMQDTRFNFFISSKHQQYLDWISRHLKTPRAVHLRWLLERDMAANKAYQADLGKEKKHEKDSSKKK